MYLKTPNFWNKKGLIPLTLFPISYLYYTLFKISKFFKNIFYKKIALKNKKIICVGNITFGGSGKTPSCIFLANILQQNGYKVVFLTRGYGRKTKGFFEVFANSNPYQYGDEPVLLAKHARTFVYSKPQQIKALENIECDFVIMDDGMQSNIIQKNKIILVKDLNYKEGNGFLFPSGPLRCKYSDIKYDIVFDIMNNKNIVNKSSRGLNSIILTSAINGYEDYINNKNLNFYAFCGLARCEKFFNSLGNKGIKLKQTLNFADHYRYSKNDIDKIIKNFQLDNLNNIVFTTEKDFVKISQICNYKNIIPIGLELIADNTKNEDILNLIFKNNNFLDH